MGITFVAALGIGHFLGQGQEKLLARQFQHRCRLGVGHNDAVIADLDLDDLLDAILETGFAFGGFDRPGGVGDVRMFDAHAGAEELKPAAGTGGFDGRRLELGGFAELFGNHGGEGVHGR